MTDVVAALIWDNGKFMIARRPECKVRGLLWEFVGGKVEKGETKKEALVRECREELGIEVEPKEEFMYLVHKYPDLPINLTVYTTEIKSGTPELTEHSALTWITPDEIDNYEFCPADKDVLTEIKRKFGK